MQDVLSAMANGTTLVRIQQRDGRILSMLDGEADAGRLVHGTTVGLLLRYRLIQGGEDGRTTDGLVRSRYHLTERGRLTIRLYAEGRAPLP